ncbi:MAG: glycosyltransferase, partial [Candidatus Eisenbacteria bacterium]|nr:glycosyltransferase [Candidatus Eisenbacteria bacterium]
VGSEMCIRDSRRAASWLFVPDSYLGWVPFARRAVARELERGGVLVTTSSPDSAHLIGLGLVAGRGIGAGPAGRRIPWVADFRDPWVRRMSLSPPTALHARAHEALEARVVRACTRMIVTSEATRRDYLARYPELDPGKIVTITNGYDEEDFAGVPVAPARDFRLVHVGQLNPERPIGPLLDHLEAFFAIRPRARTETIVEMIGPRYAEDEAEAERRGFGRLVRFAGAVAHRQAIERMLAARVLVLLEQESERGALILPGKIFEYLRSGRPVFGLVPRGAAWELLEETRAGRAALPSSPRDGAAILAGLYDRWSAGETLEPPSDRARIASFERRPLTARLAALLDDLLS